MKHVDTWLNEKQFKEYKRRAEKNGATPYAMTKTLILNWMNDEKAHEVDLTIAYWFLCYALIVASILLLF